jgi:hypothetical protein
LLAIAIMASRASQHCHTPPFPQVVLTILSRRSSLSQEPSVTNCATVGDRACLMPSRAGARSMIVRGECKAVHSTAPGFDTVPLSM